jgi:hypothetical protein
MRGRVTPRIAAIGIALATTAAVAKVASTTLVELVAGADVIVVAQDVELFEIEGWTIARARVSRTLKGTNASPDVYYLASSTWQCDTARGEIGESAVLFLRELPPDLQTQRTDLGRLQPSIGRETVYVVAHAGRGRMPIYTRSGSKYAEIWSDDVRLPKDISTEPGREAEYSGFIRGVRLELLVATVTRIIAE